MNPRKPKIPVEIITTAEGSHTLYRPDLDEIYHSRNGAIQESRYVYIQQGFNRVKEKNVRVFEVGFGTGLNAFLTCRESHKKNIQTDYHAIELYPLDNLIVEKLNYPDQLGDKEHFFLKIHNAPWNSSVRLSSLFTLKKMEGDLTSLILKEHYHIIYFDAFAPEVQPELWDTGIFVKLAASLVNGGLLVTYAAKSKVRKNMEQAGLKTHRLPGPPGKREMTLAVKG